MYSLHYMYYMLYISTTTYYYKSLCLKRLPAGNALAVYVYNVYIHTYTHVYAYMKFTCTAYS